MPSRLLPPLALLLLLAGCQPQSAAPAAAPAKDPPPAAAAVPPSPAAAPPQGSTEPPLETLVARSDTLATLQARLGTSNVATQLLAGAEGDTIAGWWLYPGDPTRTLEVYLDDSGAHPDTLVARDHSTHWTRADGVRIGMTVPELAALNGGPFAFTGFDWDYGGMVTDWRGGKLDPGAAEHGSVGLCPPADTPDDYPTGDGTFSSEDPRLPAAVPTVCEYTVPLPPAAPAP